MRPALVALLMACGAPAPAFVPVRVEVAGDDGLEVLVFAIATKKLNPACETNCEMGRALEQDGCAELFVRPDGTQDCRGVGGQYLALQRGRCDAGTCASTPRSVATDAELELVVSPYEPTVPCRSRHVVRGGMTVSIALPDCTFSERNP